MLRTPEHPIAILVVEDDLTFQQVIAFGLRGYGYSVATAENGASALEQIANSKFDLILTDLLMPVMDGLDFATRLKQGPVTPDIPVVLMSGRRLEAKLDEDSVFAAMLTKPFALEELNAIVERVVARTGAT